MKRTSLIVVAACLLTAASSPLPAQGSLSADQQ